MAEGKRQDRVERKSRPPHLPSLPRGGVVAGPPFEESLLALELLDGCVAEGGELLAGEGCCYAEMCCGGLPEPGHL